MQSPYGYIDGDHGHILYTHSHGPSCHDIEESGSLTTVKSALAVDMLIHNLEFHADSPGARIYCLQLNVQWREMFSYLPILPTFRATRLKLLWEFIRSNMTCSSSSMLFSSAASISSMLWVLQAPIPFIVPIPP